MKNALVRQPRQRAQCRWCLMIPKHATGSCLPLALALSLFCAPIMSAVASGDSTEVDSQAANSAGLFHDALADQLVDLTLQHPEPEFCQKEIFTVLLQEGLRKPDSRLDNLLDYSVDDFPRHLLTEYYSRRFPFLGGRLAAINAIFDLEKSSLELTKAILKDQFNHLRASSGPFYWPGANSRLAAQSVILATNQQVRLWNMQARANAQPGSTTWSNGGSSNFFRYGDAYRQLVDISQNGWSPSLNWDLSPGDQQASGMPQTNLQADQSMPSSTGDPAAADNYDDMDAQLSATQQSSDQAMQQYNDDANSQGITQRLQGTAQNNVMLGPRMNNLEHRAVTGDLRILAIGAASGTLIMAGGMAFHALRFAPYHHVVVTNTQLPIHQQVFSAPAVQPHVLGAPSIGGSWDGAAGQGLFSF